MRRIPIAPRHTALLSAIIFLISTRVSSAFSLLLKTTKYSLSVRGERVLSMTAQDEAASSILRAHDALQSAKMARSVRKYRSGRGRADAFIVAADDSVASKPKVRVNRTQSEAQKTRSMSQQLHRRSNGIDLPYESAFEALRAYHNIHGDLVIPRRFRVPSQASFPKEWHGIDLSSSVYNMKWWQKHVKSKPDRVAELNKLGFVWERLQPEWNLILEALITYSSIYGDVLVPNKFVVPQGDDQWPKATWKIPLGSCVYRIRARNDFLRGCNAASRREQLDGLGFVWDVHEHRFRIFYAALRHYAKLESCGAYSRGRPKPLKIPSTFFVPADEEWPKELWNFPLGVKCTAVRQKELYTKDKPDRKQALGDIGFHWGGNADLGWLEVVHAAAIYSRINNRNLNVPYHFVVPAPLNDEIDPDEWPWPKHLWGLPLGQRLKDVRTKGAYLSGAEAEKRRRQLDALGFTWKPKRGRPRLKSD